MTARDLNFIMSDVSEMSEIIPLAFALYCVRKKPPYNILVWLFSLSAPLKLASMITAKLGIHNMPIFHVLALVEGVLLYAFFSMILWNQVRWIGIAFIVVFAVIDSVLLEPIFIPEKYNALAWSMNTLMLLCMGLAIYYKIFVSSSPILLESSPIFIIVSGFMIYCAGSLFTYVFAPRILSFDPNRWFFANAWIIQSFSVVIKNLIVAFGLWKVSHPSTTL